MKLEPQLQFMAAVLYLCDNFAKRGGFETSFKECFPF